MDIPNDNKQPQSAPVAGYVGRDTLETEEEREARIYADVFNPAESNVEYFLRRGRELGVIPQHSAQAEQP